MSASFPRPQSKCMAGLMAPEAASSKVSALSSASSCTRASWKWWRSAPSSQFPQEAPNGHLCLQEVLGARGETRPSPSQGPPGLIGEGAGPYTDLEYGF